MATETSASAAVAPYNLWSKLPGDVLGEIYNKIGSPVDRVRFAAVCRSWGAITSWQPPAPTFPWLLLSQYEDGTAERAYCPLDSALLRVPLPSTATGKQLVGFHDGGWIAAVNGDSSLVIVNLFSGIEVPLSAKQRTTPTIWKVVFSEAPTSKRCILAAIFPDALAVCRVGCRKREWWRWTEYNSRFHDIAFCHGKLYGLHGNTDLNIFDVRMTKTGSPMITTTYKLNVNRVLNIIAWQRSRSIYMVSHGDKIFMALMARWSLEHEPFFKVFEVVNTNNTPNEYMWAEATTLNNHALFLSRTCSTAVHVPTGSSGGVKGNHIYYGYIRLRGEVDSICDDIFF